MKRQLEEAGKAQQISQVMWIKTHCMESTEQYRQEVGLKQAKESVSHLDRRMWAASQKLEEATLRNNQVEQGSVWGL